MPPLVALVLGAIIGAALVVIVGVIEDALKARESRQGAMPSGYWPCKNWAVCGWWYKMFEGCDECNHCWAGKYDGLKDCEEDPEIGPDWRPS